MKPSVTLLIGLPGSGKSHFGTALAEGLSRPFLDDASPDTIKEQLSIGESFIFAHPWLCLETERKLITGWIVSFDMEFIELFWENAPEKCFRNVAHRADGRNVKQTIKSLSKRYHPPDNAMTVWQPK